MTTGRGAENSVRDVVVQYLQERGWTYEEHETFLALPVVAGNGDWLLLFLLPPDTEQLVVHSLAPVDDIPAEHLANVVEFTARANFGLALGAFEIDLNEGPGQGQVRFRTGIDAEGHGLVPIAVDHLVEANVQLLDQYLPGLIEAAAGRPAADCIADVEGSAES